ncbi:PucR family transcriptional regulator [Tissierella sp.]|uniref:PucR family transcriptional regulator n=1 Tax=Tissierella sp. TaxID=41274 RepID=UPI00285FBF12|nr:PucR family transcriptional regulator [Tissierella sp.]MDR7855289.1 PucR family transcriptional regulator [Tissierella sp.]
MIVQEILKIEKFKNFKVINEKADLTRRIVTVESTETPDVATYLTPNSLLITTAMSYKDNQEGLVNLISSLNDVSCSGLAIKLGRFIDKLDEEVIRISDELGFPLLQIPLEFTLGEVYHDLLSYLWSNQNEELLLALNTQKKFSSLVMQGASINNLLNNLGHVLKKSVALMNPFGKIISYNSSCTKGQIALAENTFHKYELYNRKSGEFQPIKNSQVEKTSIYPINNVGQNYYYIFVFDNKNQVTALSEMVIEQFLLIFRLSMHKNLYILGNTHKNKEEFLNILVNRYKDEFWTPHQLMDIGKKFGLRDSEDYTIILGNLETFKDDKYNDANFSSKEEQYVLIYDWMEKELRRFSNGRIIVFPETSYFRYVILLQGSFSDIHGILSDIHDMVLKIFKIEIIFSYGNSMVDINSVRFSYKEAIESYRYGEGKENISFIKYYRPKNASDLLKSVSNEQIQGFCLHILKELAYSTDEMIIELRRTLQVYLECRCSVTTTASRMFLHRNTIKYRIKKCEDILENDLTDSDYGFQLQLALTLLDNQQQT